MRSPAECEFRRAVNRSMAVPISAGAALALLFVAENVHLISVHRAMDETDRSVIAITETLKLMIDAETGVRGYMLTADPAFLEPYRAAQLALPGALARMAAMPMLPEARQALDRARAEFNDWGALARSHLEGDRAGPAPAADARARKQDLDMIRAEFESASRVERELGGRQAEQARVTTGVSLGVLLVTAIGIGIWLATLVRARLHRLSHRYEDALAAERAALESLRRSNEKLEKRVKERTSELTAANRELEAFSYSVSHDLRAPLRSMVGFSKIVREDYGNRLDEVGRDSLGRIVNAAQRMGELVDGLLSLSRISRSEVAREDLDLAALARQITRELQEAEPGRHLRVILPEHAFARGDSRLVGLLLRNLLGNAWKFTRRKSDGEAQIELGVVNGPKTGGQRWFYVRDNGSGFDMAYVGKLFAPFSRLHSEKEFPGTGIGLATAQRIIHRHGGEIWAEGETGRGAKFTFTLPPETSAS